jgi:hypothetical protein
MFTTINANGRGEKPSTPLFPDPSIRKWHQRSFTLALREGNRVPGFASSIRLVLGLFSIISLLQLRLARRVGRGEGASFVDIHGGV